MELTHETLLSLVSYDPETGVFTNKVARRKSPAGKQLGHSHNGGYLQTRIAWKQYLLHRLAWFHVYGKWPVEHIDHINGNKQDNRICNLREATNSENMQNVKRAQKRSKSGVKGVSWDKSRNKWTAHICVGGKQRNLGRFDDVQIAASAYKQAQQVLHPFAN